MPRQHKRLPGSRQYNMCNHKTIQHALEEIASGKISINKASIKYKIPKGTLVNKVQERGKQ